MKFYIAGYSGVDSDGMDYKKLGRDKDLFHLFPELKNVIDRYSIKNIDVRFSNGDRLRIYDICKGKSTNFGENDHCHHSSNSTAARCL